MNKQHHSDLIPGETIKIGGIPYEYVGGGQIIGGTDPAFARKLRDEDAASSTGAQQKHDDDN